MPGGQLGASLTYTASTSGVLPLAYAIDVVIDDEQGWQWQLDGNATMKITCTPPPTVTVTKTLSPTRDPGKFTLQVNGEALAVGVGNDGTATKEVSAGTTVTVAEIAGDASTDLANYDSALTCTGPEGELASGTTGGSFEMPEGDVSCTFTNTRKAAPPATVTPVPTLGEWSLMLLGLLAAGFGARRLRHQG